MTGWLLDRNPACTVEQEVADNLARFLVQTRLDQLTPRVRRVRLPYGDGVRVETARRASTTTRCRSANRPCSRPSSTTSPLDQPPASLLFLRFLTSNVAHIDLLLDEFDAIVRDLELPAGP